jgi:hypothetical protein
VPALIVLAIIVLVVVALTVGMRQLRSVQDAWEQAAASLGLRATRGNFVTRPRMEGSIGPYRVEIDTYTERSGDSSNVYTRYRVWYDSLGLGLRLTPQHALHRIARFFGAQDVEVGDEEFDDAFVIKADDPTAVALFLTPSRRLGLLRLFSTYRRASVEDDAITVTTSGMERKQEKLESTMRRAVAAARRLTDADGADAPLDALLERRERGELEAVSRDVGAVVHPHPDDLDGRLVEVETLAAAGHREEAAAAVAALESALPADPEVAGWKDYLERPAPPRPGSEPLSALEDETFFDTLFASTLMSYETSRLFDERYRGRPIRWTGRVKQARRVEGDADLGPGAAIKAVVTVATIAHDLYGQTEIDAVVQLPAGAASLARGDELTFTGVLAKIDPLMRNVYVTGGRPV